MARYSVSEVPQRKRRFESAWRELAPGQKFAGLSVGEFEAATAGVDEIREELEQLRRRMEAVLHERARVDREFLDLCQRVVNGVRGTPGFGDDCPLYRALGYIPKSERKSGLTRRVSRSA